MFVSQRHRMHQSFYVLQLKIRQSENFLEAYRYFTKTTAVNHVQGNYTTINCDQTINTSFDLGKTPVGLQIIFHGNKGRKTCCGLNEPGLPLRAFHRQFTQTLLTWQYLCYFSSSRLHCYSVKSILQFSWRK